MRFVYLFYIVPEHLSKGKEKTLIFLHANKSNTSELTDSRRRMAKPTTSQLDLRDNDKSHAASLDSNQRLSREITQLHIQMTLVYFCFDATTTDYSGVSLDVIRK